MSVTQRFAVVVAGVVLVGAMAYVLGVQAGNWMNDREREELRAKGVTHTAMMLEQMGTINIGDTLADFAFEDIDGEVHLLSELVTDLSLITYVKTDCDACLIELEELAKAVTDPSEYRHFILISTANPKHLATLRDNFGLGCVLLYDEERVFGNNLRIQSYPFNMEVDADMVIRAVHGGSMRSDDFGRIIDANM